MEVALNRTKILTPYRRQDILSRQRLLDMLNELLDNRLTIIAAPAGYGKTSLLVDFASQCAMPVCWLSLDQLDAEIKRFASYLIASINQQFPEFGQKSLSILQTLTQTNHYLDQLIISIVNEAYETIQEHFVIILDDYHTVDDNSEISTFVSQLIQDVDENCHFIIASRTLISLPDLPLMVARSQVGGLGYDELAFKKDEVQLLLQQKYHENIPNPLAEELVEETEGWITGLLLSTQSNWSGMSDRLRLARVSAVGLYQYLAQQVLDQQTGEVRSFLLQSSLMEEFDAALCEKLFGSPPSIFAGWPALFNVIVKNNLFVLPVGEHGNWLRYHHLFRDFLQNRFIEEDQNQANQLTERLADIYAQNHEWERAFLLYQRLGKTEMLIQLVETAGTILVKNGQTNTLISWIDSLPSQSSTSRPILLSLRGAAAMITGDVERAIGLMSNSEIILKSGKDPYNRATNLIRRSHAYRFISNYPQALADANSALEIAQNADTPMFDVQAESYRSIGISYQKTGKLNDSEKYLKLASSQYDVIGSQENVALTQIDLGSVYRSLGKYKQARLAYENALTIFRKTGNITRQAAVTNNLGVLFIQLGEYEQASSYLEKSLHLAQQSGYLRVQAFVYLNIGDLYRNLDAQDAALNAYRHAEEIIDRIGDDSLKFFQLIAQSACYINSSQFDLAQVRLSEAGSSLFKIVSHEDLGFYHLTAGKLDFSLQLITSAINHFREAIEEFSKAHQVFDQIVALLYLAKTHQSYGDIVKENQILRMVTDISAQYPDLYGSTYQLVGLLPYLKTIPDKTDLEFSWIRKYTNIAEGFSSNISNIRRRIRRQVSEVPFAPPRLTINTLGKNQVLVDGKNVTSAMWQTQTARDMLFLLLAHPGGMKKEEIAQIFWPDSSPAQVKAQFKNTIYRMRRALNQEVVLFVDEEYFFNRNLDYEYDVDIFRQNLANIEDLTSDVEKIQAYKQAIKIYKGAYLPDIIDEWTVAERERLRHQHQRAMIHLVELLNLTRDHSSALNYCQEILASDPCSEEAHRLAMQIHANMGNKANIVRQFEKCKQLLKNELNLPPSQQTIDLYYHLIH